MQKPPALPPRNNEHNHRKYRRNSFIMSMENGQSQEDSSYRDSDTTNGEYLTPLQASGDNRHKQESEQLRLKQDMQRVRSSHDPGGPNLINSDMVTRGGDQYSRQNRSVTNISESTKKQNIRPEELPVQNVPDVERWLAGQNRSSRGRLRSDRSDTEHYPDSSSPGSYHSEESFPHG